MAVLQFYEKSTRIHFLNYSLVSCISTTSLFPFDSSLMSCGSRRDDTINYKCSEWVLPLRPLWLFETSRTLIWYYVGIAWSFGGFACCAFCPWISWTFQCSWSKIHTNYNGSHTFSGFSCKSVFLSFSVTYL